MSSHPPAQAASSTGATAVSGPILLYDGTCSFCNASVHFVLAHERTKTLRFAPLQSALGQGLIERRPDLRGVDSIIWYEPTAPGRPERVLVRSGAGLRVARYLGGPWRLAAVAHVIPRPIRDAVYDLIARHRHRLLGTSERCVFPPADARARFLDDTPA